MWIWSRGINVITNGKRFTGVISSPRRSSTAAADQFEPPRLPGYTTVPLSDGGVKIPSERECAITSRHPAAVSGVVPNPSLAGGLSGGRRDTREGEGWVGPRSPPRAALFGAGRALPGKRARPGEAL